jgi:hypothetical protein
MDFSAGRLKHLCCRYEKPEQQGEKRAVAYRTKADRDATQARNPLRQTFFLAVLHIGISDCVRNQTSRHRVRPPGHSRVGADRKHAASRGA